MSATDGRVPTQQVEGLVEATNANGLKIAGAWVNVSRFRPVELPEAGTHVRLEVDSRGYIRELGVLKPADNGPGAVSPLGKGAVSRDVSRTETITRLAVLKAAAHFVGLLSQTREDIRNEHVLLLADKWLKWVEAE
jgi:hypothetical protein